MRHMLRARFALAALTLVLCAAGQVGADVRVSSLFTDGAVLQQGQSVPVWGWASPGETVTVTFRDRTVSTVSSDGKWMVRLPKMRAGGPDVLTVKGLNTLAIADVYVGEVWVCSGQSNMQWPLWNTDGGEKAVAEASNPDVRLFSVPRTKSPDKPLAEVDARWAPCSPTTAREFSAVAYHFGVRLQKALGVPVGLIHTSWGGSPAEVWMSRPVMERNADYRKILDAVPAARQRYEQALQTYRQRPRATRGAAPSAPWVPCELYNGMIAPLIPYAIKGAIWYQGESNAGRAFQYRRMFQDLIRNWRNDWRQGDFTFLCVQLAPFMKTKPVPSDSAWAELREAQFLATQRMRKVGMAVITDVGDENDIHPRKKEPVGARLALAARGIAYGEKIVYSGPAYRSFRRDGNRIEVRFRHVGAGLDSKGQKLTGFAIAGEDRKFVWADARIVGSVVMVSSPEVTTPVAVRYGWADCPVVNLWNRDGLPATPFRTDDWPLTTAPKSATGGR